MIEQFADQFGILLRRDAVAVGIDDNALRRALDAGQLVRTRQGVYVLRSVWQRADMLQRYRLLTEGVRQLYDDSVALSHVSALVEWGGPTWGLDLTSVHLTNLAGKGERSGARVVHHRGACRVGDVTRRDGRWITTPARTALDTATMAREEAAVAVLDFVQQHGLATRMQLDATFASMKANPDTLSLLRKLRMSDGKAESVAETVFRIVCARQRIPPPIAQFEVRHPAGHVAGRVDFAWPDRKTIVEIDGKEKYLRLRRPGETIEQVVLREKSREDHLREITGWVVIRVTWAELFRPEELANRILRAFAQAR